MKASAIKMFRLTWFRRRISAKVSNENGNENEKGKRQRCAVLVNFIFSLTELQFEVEMYIVNIM